MNIVGSSVSFTVGIVIGVIANRALESAKENKVIDKEKLLEESFGEHVYASRFSLSQAKDWIKVRKDSIDNGSKALILKLTSQTLKDLSVEAEISDDAENYIVIAIVETTSGEVEDTLLVKYDELDEKLEELLIKGDGSLVVGR